MISDQGVCKSYKLSMAFTRDSKFGDNVRKVDTHEFGFRKAIGPNAASTIVNMCFAFTSVKGTVSLVTKIYKARYVHYKIRTFILVAKSYNFCLYNLPVVLVYSMSISTLSSSTL